MDRPWKVTHKKVRAAIERIVEVSQPRKIIIFGSYVRGDAHVDSDLDVLIVSKGRVENPRKESVRIRRALKGIIMSMDIVVIDEDKVQELADLPGSVYREAFKYGTVVYESAA